MTIQYPLGVLDYEASGLDDDTFPIEIGIAIRHDPQSEIQSWSSLIRPCAVWHEKGCWNTDSENIHNIKRSDLVGAPTIDHVVREAMKFAGDIPLYFDGGRFDLYWHTRLVTQARSLQLNIQSVHHIVEMKDYLEAFQSLHIEHRAGPDAIQNIEVIEKLHAENL